MEMRDRLPSVTILILNWNGRSLLGRSLEALRVLDYSDYHLVVADNGSTDDSISVVQKKFPEVTIIDLGRNLGFSKGNNAAIEQLPFEDDILVMLNNDVFVHSQWLTQLVVPFKDDTVGITGCKLLFEDGRHIQHAGGEITYPLILAHHFHYQEVDDGQADQQREVPFVTGAAMAVRRPLFEELNLFDESFSPFYFEDSDLCFRAKAAGYQVLYVPEAVAIHFESHSLKKKPPLLYYTFHRNRLRFLFKHYSLDQILNDFVPAEFERLRTTPAAVDTLESLRRAYLEAMWSANKHDWPWGDANEEQLESLREALDQLWQATFAVEPVRVPGLLFGKPILEPLFVTILKVWNAFTREILLWPVVQRQDTQNALASRLIEEQYHFAKASSVSHRVLMEKIDTFSQQVEHLTQSIEELDRRLEGLEQPETQKK